MPILELNAIVLLDYYTREICKYYDDAWSKPFGVARLALLVSSRR